MRVRRGKRPPATAFAHEPSCKTPDSEPQWFKSTPDEWQRVCSCGTQRAQVVGVDGIDPDGEAARPAARAHRHEPGCAGASVPQVVRIERRDGGGWRSECSLCRTWTLFYWTAGYGDDRGGRDAEVVSDGLFLRKYPLATPLVDEEPEPRPQPAEPVPAAVPPLVVMGRRHR